MRRRALLPALAALGAGTACAAAPAAETLRPGQCVRTAVATIGPRLEGDPASGVSVAYANRLRQTSYEVLEPVRRSRAGDPVRLCLIERPQGCPPNDQRGSRYTATNLRTGERWTAADSQHLCGGA